MINEDESLEKYSFYLNILANDLQMPYNYDERRRINMANVNITIRMDEELKKEAVSLFNDLGMGLNQAITIFVKQAVREQRIPFVISKNIPNRETLEAFKEIEMLKAGKAKYKEYDDIDKMFEDALNEV